MAQQYSFCEPVTVTSTSPWHIRAVGSKGLMFGGGIDTPFLCGRGQQGGWDIKTEITEDHLAYACHGCVDEYRRRLKMQTEK